MAKLVHVLTRTIDRLLTVLCLVCHKITFEKPFLMALIKLRFKLKENQKAIQTWGGIKSQISYRWKMPPIPLLLLSSIHLVPISFVIVLVWHYEK